MSVHRLVWVETRRILLSPGTWLATAGFSLVLAAGVAVPHVSGVDVDASTGTAFLLGPATDLVLPLLIVLFTYGAIAGHRSRGSIYVFLAAPVSRTGIFAGMLLARILVVWSVVLVGLICGVGAIFLLYGRPPLWTIAQFGLFTVFAAGAFTCIGVGISGSTGKPIRSLATLVGGFVIAHALWEPVVNGGHAVLTSREQSRAVELAVLLSPLESYGRAADGILPPSPHLMIGIDGGETTVEPGAMVGGDLATMDLFAALAFLGLWAVVAVTLGIRRFQTAEIE